MTKRSGVWFIAGITIGYLACFFLQVKNQQSSSLSIPDEKEPITSDSAALPTPEISNTPTLPSPSVTSASPTPLPVGTPPLPKDSFSGLMKGANELIHGDDEDSHLSFSLSNDELQTLEESLSVVRQDVFLNREEKGWRVHFLRPSGFFSQLGLRDQDLIRFDDLDKAKREASSAQSADRLERILLNLER